MRIYYHKGFEGHYPVGTSAIVVAKDREHAALQLEQELRLHRLEQRIDPEEFVQVTGRTAKCVILNNGDY